MAPYVILGNICDVRDGTHESPQYVQCGFPLITSKNIKNGKFDLSNVCYISEADLLSINERSMVDDGDILMPMIGTIGNPLIVKKTFEFAIKNVALIKFNHQNNIINGYVLYLLESPYFTNYVNKENRGGIQKFLSLKDIRNFKFSLPSLEEQILIVKVLDTITSIIKKRKQQIALLDEAENSLFVEMFGDPVTNPMNWKKISIQNLTRVETGSTPNRSNPENYSSNGIPWIKTGEIEYGIITSADECISDIGLKSSNCNVFPINTILVAMYGQGVTRGKAGLLKINAATNQACAALLPSNQYSSRYMLHCLKLHYHELRNISRGGNQKNLNLKIIKEYRLPIPDISLQKQFSSLIDIIERKKEVLESVLSQMEELKSALMQKYFG